MAKRMSGKAEIEPFQVFAKPVGPRCNLACGYCYYLEKQRLYPGGTSLMMEEELLELYIRQQMEASAGETVFFSWHGGEPLLAGLDFYRRATALQRKWLSRGRILVNGIQTNGTLLDDRWGRFLAEERFLTGVSLDGPAALHDRQRCDSRGRGSYRQVRKGIDCLNRHGIMPELLCVVGSHNAGHPLEVYRHFKQLGARYMTFLPLVIRDPASAAGVAPESVTPEAFGRFLCTLFDEWVEQDIGKVQIQIFEEAVAPFLGRGHTLCIFREKCGRVPVVEHNGDFYSCDHFVDKEHYLGNLRDGSLAEFLESPVQKAFGAAKADRLPRYCRECPVREMCNGECPKNRFLTTPDGEPGLNYLCRGYQLFFSHIRPFAAAVGQAADAGESPAGG